MKLLSYSKLGKSGFGALVDGGIVDLTGRLNPNVTSLKQAIAVGLLDVAAQYATGRKADHSMASVTLLPTIPDPAKILCIGLNYASHKKETGRPDVDHPTVFARYPDSQVAHGQNMIKPDVSDRFDYEGELAVIIGTGGYKITEAEALSHIAGYSCYNEGSIRDWQLHTFQFLPGKTFPGTGGFGPYLVTPDEVGDYRKLPIQTRLNGEIMQDATLADLLFPIETLISYCSHFTPLSPGDVIVTGTPGGVGNKRDPQVFMFPGDLVEVDIGVVGTLQNRIAAESL